MTEQEIREILQQLNGIELKYGSGLDDVIKALHQKFADELGRNMNAVTLHHKQALIDRNEMHKGIIEGILYAQKQALIDARIEELE